MVDGGVAVEAPPDPGRVAAGGEAEPAVPGREDRADGGGAPAQERPALQQLDGVTHAGQIHRRVDPGDAATDHHHRAVPE